MRQLPSTLILFTMNMAFTLTMYSYFPGLKATYLHSNKLCIAWNICYHDGYLQACIQSLRVMEMYTYPIITVSFFSLNLKEKE